MTNPTVTRFDIYNRADEDGERDVVRLFEKRKLVGEFDLDDVARAENEEWEDELKQFLNEKPRNLTDVMDWLGEEPAEEDEEEEREPGSIVPEKYRILYGAAQNCGDEIALTLTAFVTTGRADKKNPDGGLDRAKLRGVAEDNGLADRLAVWEENGLNGGLLRMNVSNILRGMNRRGEEVKIGAMVWPAREVPKKSRAKKSKD